MKEKALIICALGMAGFLAFSTIGSCVNHMQRQELIAYNTWMRLHPQYRLTIEEWRSLRNYQLLPEQITTTPQ